jgi:hypothetical protein
MQEAFAPLQRDPTVLATPTQVAAIPTVEAAVPPAPRDPTTGVTPPAPARLAPSPVPADRPWTLWHSPLTSGLNAPIVTGAGDYENKALCELNLDSR